jgi:peptidoglycan lytic transglycosylase G
MSEMSLSEVLPGAFPPEPPSQRRRGAAREQRQRRKRRRRRSFVVLFLTIAVVGGAVAGSYVFGLAPLIKRLTEPTDYKGAGTGKTTIKIPDGASGRDIAIVLAKQGVVKTEAAFLDAAKKDPRAKSVQPGTYAVRKQMSGATALSMLLDPTSRLTRTVTIPEGTRVAQALPLIAKKLGLKLADVRKASTSGKLGLPRAANGKLEGFLYPATYTFGPDANATKVLSAMVAQGSEVRAGLGISAAQTRTVVIKASIVEAEAGNKNYMGKVARVLENRLDANSKLQLDSTVSYATNEFKVTTSRADRASSSRYNTYKYAGLPVGPISNPGEEALKAVMDPAPGNWMYFVTTNPTTGETKFSVDAAGHAANVAEFQQWLRTH